MALSKSAIAGQAAYKWGAASLFTATGIILLALGFEYIGGHTPCELCLQQRYSYYIGIPALFAALLFVGVERHRFAFVLFLLTALAFFANAVLGAYHAGIEWGFWPGPAICASGGLQPLATGGSGVLQSLASPSGPSCGLATWRLLGLSFAGWNVVVCLFLTISCLKAAFASSGIRHS